MFSIDSKTAKTPKRPFEKDRLENEYSFIIYANVYHLDLR
jgi:hypothetical protein